jgi:hypothetical protein
MLINAVDKKSGEQTDEQAKPECHGHAAIDDGECGSIFHKVIPTGRFFCQQTISEQYGFKISAVSWGDVIRCGFSQERAHVRKRNGAGIEEALHDVAPQ